MKSELVIEFASADEMNDFIAKINPVIKICYSESKEIEEFKQKLLSLQSENDMLRIENKYIETPKNTPEAQTATFAPQETYEKKTEVISGFPRLKRCEFIGCTAEFQQQDNRLRYCPVHRLKKAKNPSSSTG